jgi:simple sugar transport system permease protein
VIQALVILFTGALDNMVRMPMQAFFLSLRRRREAQAQNTPAE